MNCEIDPSEVSGTFDQDEEGTFWVETIKLSALPRGERKVVSAANGKRIILLWYQQEIKAFDSQCPHLGISLADG